MSLLPIELTDVIIDWLEVFRSSRNDARDNTSSLKACCLVCKSWLPRSRQHLFREFTIGPTLDEALSYDQQGTIVVEMDAFETRLGSLLQMAEQSSCLSAEVVSSVRKLTFLRSSPITRIFGKPSFFDNLPFTALEEIRFQDLMSIRSMSSLSLRNSDSVLDIQSFLELLEKNPNLEAFALQNVTFSSHDHIFQILSSLSQHTHFHTLTMIDIEVELSSGLDAFLGRGGYSFQPKDADQMLLAHRRVYQGRPRLRCLAMRIIHDQLYDILFLRRKVSIFDLSNLVELDIWPSANEELRVLSLCHETLVRLRLNCHPLTFGLTSNHPFQHRVLDPVDLSRLTRLEHLHLWGFCFQKFLENQQAVLQVVRGGSWWEWVAYASNFFALDEALSYGLPSSLKELRIEYSLCSDGVTDDAAVELIRSWFPKTMERHTAIIVIDKV